MIIINNTVQVKKGFADKLIQRFDRPGNVESFEGFLGLKVLQKRGTADYDEIVINTLWESKEAHDAWARSDEFKKSHSGSRPEFIINNKIELYDVVASREPKVEVNN
ncbi:hypothetical protein BKP45_07895 [Anaerobacillus alkalidiazotrophicus]|uniref:ABM domain-containing protein n=1 Tax=Anaerobacillus alkalidiazotrophicus TaxID=472963 RepID=A0A1S2M8G9_9BACI|nr:antibiotic biosynthesis monooxygenase [Anaerobacillus alkalidiazotrophicus]OIJ20884.1 hypothetical protein BKP45_07895 [Anaerobacillus alkalidiazotrophicus]